MHMRYTAHVVGNIYTIVCECLLFRQNVKLCPLTALMTWLTLMKLFCRLQLNVLHTVDYLNCVNSLHRKMYVCYRILHLFLAI